ncbi:MAG: phytoene desaturase family protein [Flavobacteriales bacterium]
MTKKIHIIGSGISSLSAASFLARAGHDVTIFEKNDTIGGRARQFEVDGFVFDMGPSWYWMPDVFEKFYHSFGYKTQDFYELKRLDPSYRVYWPDQSYTNVPATMPQLEAWFESLEPGSSIKLQAFLKDAAYKYKVGMEDLVYKPSLSLTEFFDSRVLGGLFKMHLFSSFSGFIRKYFKHPKILALLEFPVLFLGAMPNETPALYSLMNYADIQLGTWYPMKGMHEFIKAFARIAQEQGTQIRTNAKVEKIIVENGKAVGVSVNGQIEYADIVISGADYAHTDQALLGKDANYNDRYWDKRTMAPSSLLFYVGVNKKLDNLEHHNLFFDESLEEHGKTIYKDPSWPQNPLFYMSVPSVTDPSVAPAGSENLFFLIPLAPDLKDDETTRAHYFDLLLERLKTLTGNDIKDHIVYQRSFCVTDFKQDYNAFKGNAYGLANTLRQTAILKPRIKHKKIKNLYYTGQLTVPGPGVPPSIISGEVVSQLILAQHPSN